MSELVYTEWKKALKQANPIIDGQAGKLIEEMSKLLKERMDWADRFNKVEVKVATENKSYQRLLRAVQTEIDLVKKKLQKLQKAGKLKKGISKEDPTGRLRKAEKILKTYRDDLVSEGSGDLSTVIPAMASRGQKDWKMPQVLAIESWRKEVESPIIKLFDTSDPLLKLFKKQLATHVFKESKVPAYLAKLAKVGLAVEGEKTALIAFNTKRNRTEAKFEHDAEKLQKELEKKLKPKTQSSRVAKRFIISIKHIEKRVRQLEV